MSDNTQGSGSSRKGIIGRFPKNTSGAANSLKNGFSQISGSISQKVENLKKSSTLHSKSVRDGSVYSKGIRELNGHGYEKYNIDDCGEIFISKISDKALFNDGEPLLVRATEGNFVGRADPVKVSVPVAEETPVADSMRMFSNVPRGTAVETQIVGIVGTVDREGKLNPIPVDTGFLNKMARPAPARQVPQEEVVADEPVVVAVEKAEPADVYNMSDIMSRMVRKSVPVEEPAPEEIIAPVEEPVVETIVETVEEPAPEEIIAPVEEAVSVEETLPVEGPVVEAVVEAVEEPAPEEIIAPVEEKKAHEEFFITTDEEDAAEGVDYAGTESEEDDSDYSWIEDDSNEPIAVEESVEEEIVAPVEEPVIETEAIEEIPEISVAGLPASVEVPEGLHIEGDEPSDAAVASMDNSAIQAFQETATSAEVEVSVKPAKATLAADGEALPPMSDPVIKRPNTMRFRFTNGVLTNVGSKTEGSAEGPRSPLE